MNSKTLARMLSFLLIYSVDMGVRKLEDVLAQFMYEEQFETFIEIAEIAEMVDLTPKQLSHVLATDDVASIQDNVCGTWLNIKEIDELIDKQANNWKTKAMLSADRNIMRLAVYEMLYSKYNIDSALIINEAVELAKVYGEQDSFKFINAILDTVAKERQAQ